MKVFIASLLLLASLAHADIAILPYRKTFSWKNEWSSSLKEELQKESYYSNENSLLSIAIDDDDLNELECSGYNKASKEEKSDFWIVFLASLTRAESAFNASAVSGKSRGHKNYGLLQLARQTAKKECGLGPDTKAVMNAEDNLKCGLKLMQWQLQGAPTLSGRKLRRDLEGQIFGKGIFQWGPLRQNDHRGRKLLVTWFKNHLDQLPFCFSKQQ